MPLKKEPITGRVPVVKIEESGLKSRTKDSLVGGDVDDPDPNGDVLVFVGSSTEPIRANSGILTFASSFFQRKLALAQLVLPESGDLEISITHANMKVMRNILCVIHHKDALDEITPSLLVDIAKACHNYKLAKAMQGWAIQSISRLQKTLLTRGNPARIQLLYSSFVFDVDDAFYNLSKDLILYGSEEDLQSVAELNFPGQGFGVTKALRQERSTGLDKVSTMISHACSSFMAASCNVCKRQKAAKKVCDVMYQLDYYSGELYRNRVWPHSSVILPTTRLPDIQDAVAKIKPYERSAPPRHFCAGFNPALKKDADIRKMLLDGIAELVEQQKGLCLPCVKKGRCTGDGGNCGLNLAAECAGKD